MENWPEMGLLTYLFPMQPFSENIKGALGTNMVNKITKSYSKLTKLRVRITLVSIYLLKVNNKDIRVKPYG